MRQSPRAIVMATDVMDGRKALYPQGFAAYCIYAAVFDEAAMAQPHYI